MAENSENDDYEGSISSETESGVSAELRELFLRMDSVQTDITSNSEQIEEYTDEDTTTSKSDSTTRDQSTPSLASLQVQRAIVSGTSTVRSSLPTASPIRQPSPRKTEENLREAVQNLNLSPSDQKSPSRKQKSEHRSSPGRAFSTICCLRRTSSEAFQDEEVIACDHLGNVISPSTQNDQAANQETQLANRPIQENQAESRPQENLGARPKDNTQTVPKSVDSTPQGTSDSEKPTPEFIKAGENFFRRSYSFLRRHDQARADNALRELYEEMMANISPEQERAFEDMRRSSAAMRNPGYETFEQARSPERERQEIEEYDRRTAIIAARYGNPTRRPWQPMEIFDQQTIDRVWSSTEEDTEDDISPEIRRRYELCMGLRREESVETEQSEDSLMRDFT